MEDEDVAKERMAMQNNQDKNLVLAVREIYKNYGNFCAVQNLTFGVRKKDCFGLLGIFCLDYLKYYMYLWI